MKGCKCPHCTNQKESESESCTKTSDSTTSSSESSATTTTDDYLDVNQDICHFFKNPFSENSEDTEQEREFYHPSYPHVYAKKYRGHRNKVCKHKKSDKKSANEGVDFDIPPSLLSSHKSTSHQKRTNHHHSHSNCHHKHGNRPHDHCNCHQSIQQSIKSAKSLPSEKSHQRRTSLPAKPPANHETPLHVSVNIRFNHGDHLLLRDDIFVPVDSSATLLHHFRAALKRHPSHVGRYAVMKDKAVIVVDCNRKTTYAKTTDVFSTITKLRPSRLIFTATPNFKVMRFLDERKSYKMSFNVRKSGSQKSMMEHDIIIDASGSATVAAMWESLRANRADFEKYELVALHTVRTCDEVGVRFCPEDIAVDVAKSGGKRFLFVLESPNTNEKHHHEDHVEKEQRAENKKSLSATLRNMLGLNNDLCKHKKRKNYWT